MNKVTFDTNIAKWQRLSSLAESKGFKVSFVSVTDRELAGTDIQTPSRNRITESAVWGESPIGNALWASEKDGDIFEKVLSVISNNAFPAPGLRDNLLDGQRRQLRDAMIFCAHVREKGNIFVTNDVTAFVKNWRRENLKVIGNTEILTPEEFEKQLTS